jgi:hypothetical protein
MAQKTQWAQNPQTADFSQVLGGGQTQAKPGPDWQKFAALMGPTMATQGTPPTANPLQAQKANRALGQVNQIAAGYIGRNQRLGMLGPMPGTGGQ